MDSGLNNTVFGLSASSCLPFRQGDAPHHPSAHKMRDDHHRA